VAIRLSRRPAAGQIPRIVHRRSRPQSAVSHLSAPFLLPGLDPVHAAFLQVLL